MSFLAGSWVAGAGRRPEQVWMAVPLRRQQQDCQKQAPIDSCPDGGGLMPHACCDTNEALPDGAFCCRVCSARLLQHGLGPATYSLTLSV